MTRYARTAVVLLGTALCPSALVAQRVSVQPPLAMGPLEEPASLSATMRAAVTAQAAGYRLVGLRHFSRDSVLFVYEDSSLTAAALKARSWMFGPPVTKEEADGCPPEKVLGRRIARELWRQLGKPKSLQYVMIAVRGTVGIDRFTVSYLYYYPEQLEGPWVGEPSRR